MVTVRICSKLKTSWKSVVFTNKVKKNTQYFVGIFNKTIIPLALVGYEIYDDSQLVIIRLIGYLQSHIQPAYRFMELLNKPRAYKRKYTVLL